MSFGKGGPKEQVVRQELDPGMRDYRDTVFRKAQEAAGQGYVPYPGQSVAGADPRSSAAAAQMGGMGEVFKGISGGMPDMSFSSGVPSLWDFNNPNLSTMDRAGAVGARALSGDQSAISSLMNPYQHNVVDAMGKEFDQMRGKAIMGANSDATAAGAFGGDRAALMTGSRLGELDRAQSSQIADLLHSGYSDVMNNAGVAANLGLGAGQLRLGGQQAGANYALGAGDQRLRGQGQAADYALGRGQLGLGAAQGQMDAIGQQFGMGDYFRNVNQQQLSDAERRFNERRDWGQRQLGILQSGMTGTPYGTSSSQPLYKNGFSTVAGGAATGAQLGSVIPGIGTGVGAAIGGLGGLLFG